MNVPRELFAEGRGMLALARGCCSALSGKVKHLSTKQLWAQAAIHVYGVAAQKMPGAGNAADILTHPIGKSGSR